MENLKVSSKSQIIWFLAICLPVTYTAGLILWNKGGLSNPLNRGIMYIPALTILILYWLKFKLPIFKKGDLGFKFKGFKYWVLAPLIITGISFTSYLLSFLINPEMLADVTKIKESLQSSGMPSNIFIGLVSVILLNGLVGSLINIPMFLGEEIAWRGFLTPRLLQLFSEKKAHVISGVIWAAWHFVMIAQGLNYPTIHPVLGFLMMILFCIPVGFIFQYYFSKSGSIFVAALAHGGLNKSAMTITFLLKGDTYNTLIYGPTGIIGISIFWVAAVFLFKRNKAKDKRYK